MRTVAVIGAGVGGMAAAYDLAKGGAEVVIFEQEDSVGGLAAGFREEGWAWSLEKYYHHWFQSDKEIRSLLTELGMEQNLHFYRPKTVVFHNENFYPLDSPIAALLFPALSLIDKLRFGLTTAYLRYLSSWKPLEKYTAHEWMLRYYGEKVYSTLFEPLLEGKFSHYYQQVTMAWFWARFKARSERLGTYEGGFQAFLDDFACKLKEMGVEFHLRTTVDRVFSLDGKIGIRADGKEVIFDQALATIPPDAMLRLAPDLDRGYSEKLASLHGLGAVVLIVSLKHELSEQGYYWFNLPKSAGFPFLALVEHTNFLPKENYGGEHLVYCGDYLEPNHAYFSLSKEELLERFLHGLKKINKKFEPSWVNRCWLFRTPYAQPIPLLNHSTNIPSLHTSIPGLFYASMSQVYPWDRGTNFAVKLGREAAEVINSGKIYL